MTSVCLFFLCFTFFLCDCIISFPLEHFYLLCLLIGLYVQCIRNDSSDFSLVISDVVAYLTLTFCLQFSFYFLIPFSFVMLVADALVIGFVSLSLPYRHYTVISVLAILAVDLFLISTKSWRNFGGYNVVVIIASGFYVPVYFILNSYFVAKHKAEIEGRPKTLLRQATECAVEKLDLSENETRELNQKIEKYAENVICPISQEIMKDPVILVADGHTYDRPFISEWLRLHNTSPMTGLRVGTKELVPNIALRNVIVDFEETEKILTSLAHRKSQVMKSTHSWIDTKRLTWMISIDRLVKGGLFVKHGRYGYPKLKWVGLVTKTRIKHEHKRSLSVQNSISEMSLSQKMAVQSAVKKMYPDDFCIEWRNPSDANVENSNDRAYLSLSEIYSIVPGQNTAVFKRKSGVENRDGYSFSIIAIDRTLDLEADSVEARDQWVNDFNTLLEIHAFRYINDLPQDNQI